MCLLSFRISKPIMSVLLSSELGLCIAAGTDWVFCRRPSCPLPFFIEPKSLKIACYFPIFLWKDPVCSMAELEISGLGILFLPSDLGNPSVLSAPDMPSSTIGIALFFWLFLAAWSWVCSHKHRLLSLASLSMASTWEASESLMAALLAPFWDDTQVKLSETRGNANRPGLVQPVLVLQLCVQCHQEAAL